jgi:bifunctional isochorismate lyase/aryl carrier protein
MGIPTLTTYELPRHLALSRAALPWSLEPTRAALLIHDMQNYFVERYESAAFVDRLVTAIRRIRGAADRAGLPTFYTLQPGGQGPAERGLLLDRWGPGMPGEAQARAVVRGLEPAAAHRLIIKHRYSAFHRSELGEAMSRLGRSQLINCGVYAHIGCLVTAADAFMSDIQPFLVGDAVADFSLEHHQMALRHVGECTGKVVWADEVIASLEGTP